MTDQNTPKTRADSKLEFLVLAGLLAGFGLFLSTAVDRTEQSQNVESRTVVAETQESEPPAGIPSRDKRADAAHKRASRKFASRPVEPRSHVGKRLQAFTAEIAKNPLPPIVNKEHAEEVGTVAAAVALPAPKLIEPPQVTEASLRSDLMNAVPVFGLNQIQSESVQDAIRAIPSAEERPSRPFDAVLALLPDSAADGLPFARGAACRLDETKARALDEHAAKLHEQLNITDQSIRRRYPTSADSRRNPAIRRMIKKGKWQGEEAIPALFQVLQVETEPVRGKLVEMAAKHRGGKSTDVLVNRAVFDLSPNIRGQAVEALQSRSRESYREELLENLRYPWPAVAWNSAQVLVALKDKEAVPDLVKLLDAPDPAKPHHDESGNVVVKQLVRIPHMQNCLLCHAPAKGTDGLVRGKVPNTRVRFVTEGRGRRSYYRTTRAVRPEDVFVRADVTYLRQDFSLVHNPRQTGPGGVRFDYLVLTRPATKEEIAATEEAPKDSQSSYPQRDAVLYALQKLTGANPGPETEDWLALTP